MNYISTILILRLSDDRSAEVFNFQSSVSFLTMRNGLQKSWSQVNFENPKKCFLKSRPKQIQQGLGILLKTGNFTNASFKTERITSLQNVFEKVTSVASIQICIRVKCKTVYNIKFNKNKRKALMQ